MREGEERIRERLDWTRSGARDGSASRNGSRTRTVAGRAEGSTAGWESRAGGDAREETRGRRRTALQHTADSNHKKWSESELRAFVGEEIFAGFRPGGQIVNHDCLEESGLEHLGETPSGCVVEHNRRFVEADLMIYVGQVMAYTWGGYTGTGAVIGMASTRSILSHHNHGVVNHPHTATGDHRRMYFRKLKAEISAHIEQATGKRIFYINWVGSSGGRMAGSSPGTPPRWSPPPGRLPTGSAWSKSRRPTYWSSGSPSASPTAARTTRSSRPSAWAIPRAYGWATTCCAAAG